MKKHITLVLSIAALLGVLNIGCDDDNDSTQESSCKTVGFVNCNGACINPITSSEFCGANEYCEGYVNCGTNQICQAGHCVANETTCSTDGDVLCDNRCIDPMTSNKYCGADEHCKGYTECTDDTSCQNGTCQKTQSPEEPDPPTVECKTNEHLYNDACEPDDADNCGTHGASCSLKINGWASGDCIQTTCTVKSCVEGMHVYDNTCESDDIENCGLRGRVCANTVAGWKTGACTQGKCKVLQCIDNFHVDAGTGECVQDTSACCGPTCTKCADGLVCAAGVCLSNCTNGDKYCNGVCANTDVSPTNCGECGHDCNTEMPPNAQSMICTNGACMLATCKENYRISGDTCVPYSETTCGKESIDCTKTAGWNTGSCEDGKCIPKSCQENYHVAKTDSNSILCELDSPLNCGGHGIACKQKEDCVAGKCVCAEGLTSCGTGNNAQCINIQTDVNNCGSCGHACENQQMCSSGQCIGKTICDGIVRDTQSDVDHCGGCNQRCPDGKICSQGQCKVGIGTAYCNGEKVQIGTPDRCSGCTDRCADGKSCQNNSCVDAPGNTYCSGVAINTMSNLDHCGNCNYRCSDGLICSNGKCQAGNGNVYCSGEIVSLSSDSAHCGKCKSKCPINSRCSGGYCHEGTGSTYCNGKLINTSTDDNNCGQCGYACPYGGCHNGGCTIKQCNGIITNLMNDSANCGQCGKKCDVDKTCQSGTCQLGIGATYCDGKSINTSKDSANCGQCGKKCGVGQICKSGTCRSGTDITYCDGKFIDSLSNDNSNCGQCGNTCILQTCKSGVCTNPSVGDTIVFGKYNDSPIHWYILDNDTVNHRLMLLSKYVLEKRPYHTKSEDITWEQSTIRSWLNGYGSSENKQGQDYTASNFIKSAFTDEEKAQIPKVTVVNDANPQYGTPGGNNTQDYVFLLSINEVNTLLLNNMCEKIFCNFRWWLRSPGLYSRKAANVGKDGLDVYGFDVDFDETRVRPALWVNY